MRLALGISALGLALVGASTYVSRSPSVVAEGITSAVYTPRASRDAAGDHDWTQFGFDLARSSAPSAPTGITAANVASMRRQQVPIDGTVDATAIYLAGARVNDATHDLVVVTTTYGKTIALDADNGDVLWQFTPPGYDSWAGSARITNATPIADPDRESVYAASPDGHVEKLALANGQPIWSTSITLMPEREKIASPLSLFHGHVIAMTGGYIGDAPPYQGHVALLDAGSGRLLHVWNSLCSDRTGLIQPESCDQSGSAIWGRAGAVIDATTGDIFVATGNGRWDGRTDWGDATLVLDADATHLVGNETPANTDVLDETDADVGSTSPVLLGDGYIAQGGKDGRIRVLELSQIAGAAPHKGVEVQTVATPSGDRLFTAPAVWHAGSATWMFVADRGGTAAFTVGRGHLESKWANRNAGTSPVVAGGLLYVYDPGGMLRVYDPESGRSIAELPCGAGHWNSPIVVDGKIILPEGNANRHDTRGVIDIWHLP